MSTSATSAGDQPTPPRGLRERNRERTRNDIADVALRLFVDRGFDAVTVDDIASEAGISRRTFFRYFESKEDAALLVEDTALEALRDRLATRPPDEPILVTIRRATVELLAEIIDADEATTVERLKLASDTPAIYARSLEHRSRWELELRNTIAEHLDVEPATSLVATVAAAAAIGAARAATDVWIADGAVGDLTAYVTEAYDLLADGLAVER